jgi:UrcA family protein
MDFTFTARHRTPVRPFAALLASAAITTLLGLAVSATLPAAELRQERVQVSDLDLSSKAGQRQLQRRVTSAVERVCEPGGAVIETNVRARLALQACRRAAREGVQRQLDAAGETSKLRIVRTN